MIALSGCAKRNADRELARVVAFIDARLAQSQALPADGPIEEVVASAVNLTLAAVRDSLAAHAHRNLAPESRLADQPTDPG